MRFPKFIRDFFSNNRGVAAIEFALAGPVLILAMTGTVTAFDLYRADRAISHTTNTVVDLVSRQAFLDDTQRDRIFLATRTLIGRFGDDASFVVSATSVVNDDGILSVDWSEASDTSSIIEDQDLAALDLPTIPDGESVIFVRVSNTYSPVFDTSFQFSREAARRPRFVPRIAYDDNVIN